MEEIRLLQLTARRLLLLIPTMILVTFGVFSLIALAPGDAATYIAGGQNASPAKVAEVREELGLDDPYLVQYLRWLGAALRLDFGESLVSDQSVTDEIMYRLPVTLSIMLGSVFVGLLVALPIGLISGSRPGGLVDKMLLLVTSAALATPNFVLAIVLINFFAVKWGWFDPIGFTRLTSEDGLQVGPWLKSMTLPSLALGLGFAARLARQIRAGIVDTLDEPYVRTAWAKGSRPRRVICKHVLKNAAVPSVTVAGLMIGGMLGGTVIVESIFAAPGLGQYLVRAITSRDMPVVQGVAVMFVVAFALINLAVDLIYGWLNPKIEVA
jgi:peptide/nickel transport system permease protein